MGRHSQTRLQVVVMALAGAIALCSLSCAMVIAQQGDEQHRFLEVRQRQLELQAAREQYERTRKLADEGLVPRTQVEHDRNAIAMAQLNYQQAVLTLLNVQPRISVRSAVKSQTSDGRKFVRLVIANLTPTFDDSQFKLLNNFEGADPIPEALRTRVVNDVFVSLRDNGPATAGELSAGRTPGATISLPYEVHIPQMKYGEEKTLDYQLLRDADTVVVGLTYRGQTQEVAVQLRYEAGGGYIQVASSQFSQEADLGSQATYTLTLERPTVDVRSFQLRVINLPRQVSYSFIDLQTQARLSEINFPAGQTRQSLGLRLFLPERADNQVEVDKTIEFWALALDQIAAARFEQQRVYTDAELAPVGPSKVRLIIAPRGVGKIEAAASSLFSEIEMGQNLESKITLRNTGSRRLDNIKISADHPLNWRVEIEPGIVPSLEINNEATVTVRVLPPPDVTLGDYEVRIKTESFADNRRVQSEDKICRINIKAKPSLFAAGALISGLLVIVSGIVFFSVKITRR